VIISRERSSPADQEDGTTEPEVGKGWEREDVLELREKKLASCV